MRTASPARRWRASSPPFFANLSPPAGAREHRAKVLCFCSIMFARTPSQLFETFECQHHPRIKQGKPLSASAASCRQNYDISSPNYCLNHQAQTRTANFTPRMTLYLFSSAPCRMSPRRMSLKLCLHYPNATTSRSVEDIGTPSTINAT